MAAIVLGGIFRHWELTQFSAVFVLIALLAGLVGGLGWRGTSEQFAEGLRRLILASGYDRECAVQSSATPLRQLVGNDDGNLGGDSGVSDAERIG
jgi:hypothetical protein